MFDVNRKKTLICHPVMAFFMDLERKNQSPELWMTNPHENPLNLGNYGSYSMETVSYYFQKYQMLKENGYFQPLEQTQSQSKRLSPEIINAALANINQVVFETTDTCCLECDYCGYGKYYDKSAPRSNRFMDNQMARTTIDFLRELLNSNLNPSHERTTFISFYGGEPLMNFPLIRDTIEYVRQLDWKHNQYAFSMTTNAMLLEKYMDFLVEHQFNLLISLDGDLENNQYRVKKDGSPAYPEILRQVKLLQVNYPGYFQEKVNFNAVLHNKNSVDAIYHFFKTNFNKIPTISPLNNSGIRDQYQEEFRNIYVNQTESLYKSENYGLLERELFISLNNIQALSLFIQRSNDFCFDNYNDMIYSQQPKIGFPSGTCIPFGKKMFVTVDGRILGCERIDQDFYLNNACSFTCDICSIAYRNFLCCTTSGNPQQELAWPKISAFLTEIAHSGFININILGGNCLAYSHFSQLKEQLTTFKCRKTFWLHYLNISLEQQRLKQLTIANSQLKMLVSFPIQEDSFQQALASVLHENLHTTLVFMIQNDQEYQQAELLITRFQLDFVEFLPVFNGQNEQFFKENFFIDRADIQANRPPLHDIYINHSLNAADFGKLTVMADGKLYANVNDAPMGELGKDSIYPLLLNELGEKKSWRLTRKDVFPCRSCTFQMLCPTINNYNRLMKRYNLCHIR